MRDGAGGALMDGGRIGGSRSKRVINLVLAGTAIATGIVVVGGGIVLFVTALFG